MITKIFGSKKIKIKKLSKVDLRNVKKFQDFTNSLIKKNDQILINKKFSLKEEKKWLNGEVKQIKSRKTVDLVAECDDKIVGTTGIDLSKGRQNHVGIFGITIRNGYRGIGLGKYLMKEIIKLAKKELKPKPKIIRLSVFPINKPAISFYKKFGFKRVAKIPKQIQYKGKLLDEIIMLLEL
ncbi:MAG: GNAT family N-acetyltransferase [Candidatus Nealsonbacteria bacterium]|nr:GNAT family N-acetyltransferase [Candidatus Nealsonbacteria bacterium]